MINFLDLDVNGKIILKWILKKQGVKVLTEFSCFRIWSNAGLFLNTVMNIGLHYKWRIS
jgi:hypothetical protein